MRRWSLLAPTAHRCTRNTTNTRIVYRSITRICHILRVGMQNSSGLATMSQVRIQDYLVSVLNRHISRWWLGKYFAGAPRDCTSGICDKTGVSDVLNVSYLFRADRTRSFVFDNYTWEPKSPEYSFYHGKLIPARIPLAAMISGEGNRKFIFTRHADRRPLLQDHSSVGHSNLGMMRLALSPESTLTKSVRNRNVSPLILRKSTTRQCDLARPLGHRTYSTDGWKSSTR